MQVNAPKLLIHQIPSCIFNIIYVWTAYIGYKLHTSICGILSQEKSHIIMYVCVCVCVYTCEIQYMCTHAHTHAPLFAEGVTLSTMSWKKKINKSGMRERERERERERGGVVDKKMFLDIYEELRADCKESLLFKFQS